MSVSKVVISTLCACLLSVVGLFLYSEYYSNQTASDNSTVAESNSTFISPSEASSQQDKLSNNTAPDAAQQPDKSLPIPAHQLKKVIADSGDTTADDLQQKIQQKIAALDKKLAEIDQKLPSEVRATAPSVASSTAAQGAASTSDETTQRIQNLRDHLEK